MRNNWAVGGGFNANGLGFDDRATRGGPGAYANPTHEVWAWINSDNRRQVSANLSGDVGGDAQGSSWAELTPEVIVRPVPAVLFSVGARFNRSVVDSQWVNEPRGTEYPLRVRPPRSDDGVVDRSGSTTRCRRTCRCSSTPSRSCPEATTAAFKELVDGRNPDYANRYAPFDYNYADNGIPTST